MGKAKEISALWSQIKPQIGELVRLCHEVESHAEDTSEAYRCGYETAKHECEDCNTNIVVEAIRKEAYEKAYEQGRKDGKIEGQAETWVCVKKIAFKPEIAECVDDLVRIGFDVGTADSWSEAIELLFEKYSASEAIEKIRQYEQEKEGQIQVGDEVIRHYKNEFMEGDDAPSIFLSEEDGHFRCLAFNGRSIMIAEYPKNQYRKTGRHFPEIVEVLQKMKESQSTTNAAITINQITKQKGETPSLYT